MAMNEADFLASVTLFSHLKDRDLRRLAKKCEYCFFKSDEVIITEGERDGRLFMLIDGKACVYKGYGTEKEKFLRTLEPPAYFGEIALIDDWVRTATVVAKGNVKAFSLDQWNLRQEIKKYPVIAIELMQMLNKRLLALEKNLLNATGGLIPICFNCKKISDDQGAWMTLEQYIRDYTEYEFSQGICPECMQKLGPTEG